MPASDPPLVAGSPGAIEDADIAAAIFAPSFPIPVLK
jgi:hypothetical protein